MYQKTEFCRGGERYGLSSSNGRQSSISGLRERNTLRPQDLNRQIAQGWETLFRGLGSRRASSRVRSARAPYRGHCGYHTRYTPTPRTSTRSEHAPRLTRSRRRSGSIRALDPRGVDNEALGPYSEQRYGAGAGEPLPTRDRPMIRSRGTTNLLRRGRSRWSTPASPRSCGRPRFDENGATSAASSSRSMTLRTPFPRGQSFEVRGPPPALFHRRFFSSTTASRENLRRAIAEFAP